MQSLSQVARDLNTKKLFKSYGFSVGERRITVTREREERLKELELKYQEFIKTDSGKKWLDDCKVGIMDRQVIVEITYTIFILKY